MKFIHGQFIDRKSKVFTKVEVCLIVLKNTRISFRFQLYSTISIYVFYSKLLPYLCILSILEMRVFLSFDMSLSSLWFLSNNNAKLTEVLA